MLPRLSHLSQTISHSLWNNNPLLSEFLAPVYAGDYIEAVGEIVKVGNTSRKMVFEARKVVAARPDISASAADVLAEPIVVCRASGTCVVKKEDQRKG
jgi:3-aminobutyryl-CoA ammonia-lyase